MRQDELLQKKAGRPALMTRRFNKDLSPSLRLKAGLAPALKSLEQGFTLFELTLAIAIYALAACGVLSLFISSATQAESAGNITSAINLAREELEDTIRCADFETLASYSKLPPDIPDGMALACYIQGHSMNNLKIVRVVVSYTEKGNRIIGEDSNLDGLLNAGEDRNGDGRLTSPCELASYIARKE